MVKLFAIACIPFCVAEYTDLGPGKCWVPDASGGREPAYRYLGQTTEGGCQESCDGDNKCTGYSYSGNCLTWEEPNLVANAAESWGGCHCAVKDPAPPSPPPTPPAPSPPTPAGGQLAAAWMYVAETEESWWYTASFDKIDMLYIGPAGIQQDLGGKFGILPSLQDKFRKVVQTARAANPDIRILVSQWWGEGQESKWGESLSHLGDVNAYASEVVDVVTSYGLDGYDIDYEGGNVNSKFPSLSSALRMALDSVSTESLFTISPASTSYLSTSSLKNIDYINMQSYAGGSGISPSAYTSLGFPSRNLLYGICPETNCYGPSADSACSTVKSNGLGGIHTWRLNSDNHATEDSVVQTVFQKIRAGDCDGAAGIVV